MAERKGPVPCDAKSGKKGRKKRKYEEKKGFKTSGIKIQGLTQESEKGTRQSN